MKTIREYCDSKKITLAEFAKIVGISAPYVYKIQENRDTNMTIKNILQIYDGTKEKFGDGLSPESYLNLKGYRLTIFGQGTTNAD